MHSFWPHLILLVAPWLVVLPAAMHMLRLSSRLRMTGFLAAILFSCAPLVSAPWAGGLMAGAWLCYSIYLFLETYRRHRASIFAGDLSAVATVAAFLYLCIGSLWGVAERLGFNPLGFDPVIVLLTAVHFHYAGFALCWVGGQVSAHTPGRWEKRWAVLPVLGVPLTAAGITTSQLGQSPLIELAAVAVMAAGGLAVAYLQLKLAFFSGQQMRVRLLWSVAGLALTTGMSLALAYGFRYYFPLPWLSIPFMYVLHGSLNSLGFAAPAIFGWLTQRRFRN